MESRGDVLAQRLRCQVIRGFGQNYSDRVFQNFSVRISFDETVIMYQGNKKAAQR